MNKILILVILLLTNNNFCGGFGPDENKAKAAIEVLQHVVKTNGCGAPYSSEIIDCCKNMPSDQFFSKEVGMLGLAFMGIGATYKFVSNITVWKPVVAEAVHAAKTSADAYDKSTQAPTSPRTKKAKEEVDTLSLQQLQLLAATEAQSNPGKTYWKSQYEQALKNQLK